MKKLIALVAAGFSLSAAAQTLFYYGKDSVSTANFLRAYQKNNAALTPPQSVSDYLDLYIASRLKIAEARALGYDTLPQMVADLENLRQQILPGYLVDKEAVDRLATEAFQRAQKDVQLAHIFIGTRNSTGPELAAAQQKAQAAMAALKSGKAFEAVAKQYSDDPSAANNGGRLGWITVFSLPYELENLAYNTSVGAVSALHRSAAGFHIFKKLGERKALGQMKAAQLLLAYPPGIDAAGKAALKKRADSLYRQLVKGADFGKLAASFSNDMASANANGQLPDFGVGQYDALFEARAFALEKDGAFTLPFETVYGWHIVKRLGRMPVAAQPTEQLMTALKEKVAQGDRMKASRAALIQKVLKQAAFKKLIANETALWSYSDSILNNQKQAAPQTINPQTAVAAFNQQTLTAADWIGFAQTFRYKPDGSGTKNYPQLWDEFVEAQAMDYYQKHLGDFNESFKQQYQEFEEGNLFFEIMQRKVWGPAQTDSAGLLRHYEANKAQYKWKESADAVIFYASDTAAARMFLKELKANPKQWQLAVSNMSEKIAADSGRFEREQLPNFQKQTSAGSMTNPLVNEADNTVSFAYIIQLYPAGQPRNFTQAKGQVMTDYQASLEKQWLESLRQQYPVRINGAEWQKIK